jgi:hypothetical protein
MSPNPKFSRRSIGFCPPVGTAGLEPGEVYAAIILAMAAAP